MRTTCLVSTALFTMTILIGQDTANTPEASIRHVITAYLNAREQRDANEVRQLFTDDADQLVSSGEWRKGREALVTGTLASSQRTAGHRTINIENIRFLTPDVAIADGRYDISGLAGGGTRHMWTCFVLERSAGKWQIAAIRNMLPAPPVPTANTPAKN